jgi:hypothetical protein
MQCHEVDYEILGGDMQIVEVELDPGGTPKRTAIYLPFESRNILRFFPKNV